MGKEGAVVRGRFWARFLRATTQALGPLLTKFDPVPTKFHHHDLGNAIPLTPFRGLPDSRCTKPCSRGATPGEIERLGHRRNTDLRARSASSNEHDANNRPRSQAGAEPVRDL